MLIRFIYLYSTNTDIHHGHESFILQVGSARRWWCGKNSSYTSSTLSPDDSAQSTLSTDQLCLNRFSETYDPTIEDSWRKQAQIGDESCTLEVLDTAGQEHYTTLRDQWIRDNQGFLLVYSISSRASFTGIEQLHRQIRRVKEAPQSRSPAYPLDPPIMLVGNKCDRATEREVTAQEGSSLAKQLRCDFIEASAKTCVNVETAFFAVVRRIQDHGDSNKDTPETIDYTQSRGDRRNGRRCACVVL